MKGVKRRVLRRELLLDFPQQMRWVLLHCQEVVAPCCNHLIAQVALAEEAVSHDDASLEHHRAEQFEGRLVLVRLGAHPALAQDAAGLMIDRSQQMHGRGERTQRRAERFAVDADGVQRLFVVREVEIFSGPAPDGPLEGRRIETHQEVAKTVEFGRASGEAHPVPDVNCLIVQPFDQGGITAIAAQNPADHRRQHGAERMTSSVTPAWIRDLRQMRQQAPRASRCHDHTSMPKPGTSSNSRPFYAVQSTPTWRWPWPHCRVRTGIVSVDVWSSGLRRGFGMRWLC